MVIRCGFFFRCILLHRFASKPNVTLNAMECFVSSRQKQKVTRRRFFQIIETKLSTCKAAFEVDSAHFWSAPNGCSLLWQLNKHKVKNDESVKENKLTRDKLYVTLTRLSFIFLPGINIYQKTRGELSIPHKQFYRSYLASLANQIERSPIFQFVHSRLKTRSSWTFPRHSSRFRIAFPNSSDSPITWSTRTNSRVSHINTKSKRPLCESDERGAFDRMH